MPIITKDEPELLDFYYYQNEVWKSVVGYEGLYEVSDMGRVRSIDRHVTYSDGKIVLHKGRILRIQMNDNGYLVGALSKDGIATTFQVHRLVAIAFIPNTNNKPEVNHINCIRSDARSANLEWVTRSENNLHGFQYGSMCQVGELNAFAKITENIAREIKQLKADGLREMQIVRKLGLSRSIVKDVNSGKSWKHVKI